MTEKKIALVKNEAIEIAMEMKLNNWIIISKHAEEKYAHQPQKAWMSI